MIHENKVQLSVWISREAMQRLQDQKTATGQTLAALVNRAILAFDASATLPTQPAQWAILESRLAALEQKIGITRDQSSKKLDKSIETAQARYQQIAALRDQGLATREIARQTGASERTVRRAIRAQRAIGNKN